MCSVRGPLTRSCFLAQGYGCPELYGDPGLLLPLVYHPAVTGKQYSLGLIPHYVDYQKCKNMYRQHPDIKIVNVCQPVEKVVNEIRQCKATFSSSLHGLVVSHAYGIPSVWVEMSDLVTGKGYKFRDYYGSLKMNGSPTSAQQLRMYKSPQVLRKWAETYPNPTFPVPVFHILTCCPFLSEAQKRLLWQHHQEHPVSFTALPSSLHLPQHQQPDTLGRSTRRHLAARSILDRSSRRRNAHAQRIRQHVVRKHIQLK